MTVTLLLDADIIAFRACTMAEVETEWDFDQWTLDCDHTQAKKAFEDTVDALMDQAGADACIHALTGPENFRYTVAPTYKSNRAKGRKPLGFAAFKDWIRETYTVKETPALEGDDVLGILMTHPTMVPGTKVLWSDDKDLKQIPGLHLQDRQVVDVSVAEADRFFYTQALTGDPTDGFKGCPGVGAVKAGKLLDPIPTGTSAATCAAMWPVIVESYQRAGLSEGDALTQARLARILRHTDYDFKSKKVKLWTPTL
jgi:DNA polymerase-1